jgi:hypothetical protein
MALQTSGAISLDDIHVEAGGTSGTQASMNDTDIRGLNAATGKTINSTSGSNTDFADYYGAFAFDYTDGSGAVNGAVPDGGPYYTLVTSATTSTVLSAGKYNFVMVGRGGSAAGSASSIALWSITLNGTEGWSWTLGSGVGSTVFTTWQIVGDNTTEVAVRHGTSSTSSTTAVGTKGSSTRITEYAARIGGGGQALNSYRCGGGGSVDFFDLSTKSDLNGVPSGVNSSNFMGQDGDGGAIKETGNPASGTKWLNNLSDTDFERANGYYANITTGGSYGNYNSSLYDDGFSPFGGAGCAALTDYSSTGNVYASVLGRNGGYGGGGGSSLHTTLNNPKRVNGVGGEPALWYLKV